MKRVIAIICIMSVLTMLLSGCATIERITTLRGLEGKILGMMANPISAEDAKIGFENGLKVSLKDLLYFDNTAGAVSALLANQIDAVFAPAFTGNYYARQNDRIKSISIKGAQTFAHMVLRTTDTELLETINSAISEMKADGTLDRLFDEFLNNSEGEPDGLDMPKLTDAKTVIVGISGDFPPFDFIAANGKAGGISAQMLIEISNRKNINFEIVNMANEMKFTALVADRIDLFILHVINDNIRAISDVVTENPGIVLSEPYYTTNEAVFLVLK